MIDGKLETITKFRRRFSRDHTDTNQDEPTAECVLSIKKEGKKPQRPDPCEDDDSERLNRLNIKRQEKARFLESTCSPDSNGLPGRRLSLTLACGAKEAAQIAVHNLTFAKYFNPRYTTSAKNNEGSPVRSFDSIPKDWFRSPDDFRAMEARNTWFTASSAVDYRYPIILITGLPFVGKSTVARELGILLEERDIMERQSNIFYKAIEAAMGLFADPSARPAKDTPSGTGRQREMEIRPVESFAKGRAIVIDVNHLGWAHKIDQDNINGTGPNKTKGKGKCINPDANTEAYMASFCSSIEALKDKSQLAARDCIDEGRRKAFVRGLSNEGEQKTIIFTDCLYKNVPDDKIAAEAYETAAKVFERRIIPIYLECGPEEHQRRFECRRQAQWDIVNKARGKKIGFSDDHMAALTPERFEKASRRLKSRVTGKDELYTFSEPAHHAKGEFTVNKDLKFKSGDTAPSEGHQGVRIDTTGHTARQTAMVIRDFVHDVIRGKPQSTWLKWPATDAERYTDKNTRRASEGWHLVDKETGDLTEEKPDENATDMRRNETS